MHAVLFALSLSLVSTAGAAAPQHDGPDLQWIAADATWTIHIDFEQALQTRIGRLAAESARPATEFTNDDGAGTEIDIYRDIRWVTAYGYGAEDAPVVLLEVSESIERMIDEARNQHNDLSFELIDGIEVIRWEDGVATIRDMARADSRLLVAATDSDTLLHALAVIDDAAPSAADQGQNALAGKLRPGAFVIINVPDLDAVKRHLPDTHEATPEVLERTHAIFFQFGEWQEQAFLEAAFAMANEKDAQDVAQVAQGLVAMGRMMISEEEELRAFEPVLRALTINAADNQVRFLMEISSEKLIKAGEAVDADSDI